MPKTRVGVTRSVRDSVLKEFNHRCAICGNPDPQLHHIDGNPSNNQPSNLIPLCPNHHLQDQHDPTKPLHPKRLELFRQFKDPAILDPKFQPIFMRLRYLNEVTDRSDINNLQRETEELLDFVAALQMGQFYSKQLGELLKKPRRADLVVLGDPSSEAAHAERRRKRAVEYRQQLVANRAAAFALIVELLRFQQW